MSRSITRRTFLAQSGATVVGLSAFPTQLLAQGGLTPARIQQGDNGDHGPFCDRTYLYIRTHPADNGTEPLPSGLPFWVSPDITVIRPGGIRGGEARVGESDQVEVIVTNSCGITAVDAFVDAFEADPSTAFTPTTATPIDSGFLTIPGYNTAAITFPWTPPPGPEHRCLLARVFLSIPFDGYVNGAIFDVVGDRHVAQRNVHVVQLPPEAKAMSFGFNIVNPLQAEAEFIVQAAEVRIGRDVDLVRAALECGYVQFGSTPLRDIRLAVGDVLPPPDITDPSGAAKRPPLGVLPQPLEGERIGVRRVKMAPGEVRYGAVTVARNTRTFPQFFHIVQVAQTHIATNRLVGGLWIAVEH